MFQSDLDRIFNVASSWGLSFAIHKTARLRFVRPFKCLPPPLDLFIGGTAIPLNLEHVDLGVTVDIGLKFHKHISGVVGKARGVSYALLRGTINRSPVFMKTVFVSHIRPLLEFSSPVWNTGYAGDLRSLESVQRSWTKQVDGLCELPYSDRLHSLSMYSMYGRLIRADLILVWKVLHGNLPYLEHLFLLSEEVRTRGHPLKLFVPRVLTDIRARFFSVRILHLWNSLPAKVVMADSLDSFKFRLHGALGDLLYSYLD